MALLDSIAPVTLTAPRMADETATILAAQAGDETATLTLIYHYGALLRRLIRDHAPHLDAEDAEAATLVAVCEAIAAWSPDRGVDRLGPLLRRHVIDALVVERAPMVTVNYKAVRRFRKALAVCNGNYGAAAKHAAAHLEMSERTFWAVAAAVHPWGGLEEAEDSTYEPCREVEARELWRNLSAALTEREAAVVAMSYGFADGEPKSDNQIADALCMQRRTVQRVRVRALSKLRGQL